MTDYKLKKLDRFSLPTEIEGERIIIKQRTHEYDEELWKLIDGSRDFLRQYLYWVDGTRSLDNVRDVTDMFMKNFAEQSSFEYVFLDKATGKLVGAGGVIAISYDNHNAEFGYYLDKNATGHGYITDFVQVVGKELFDRGIHRLVIRCDVNNTPSAAVAERCGFILEGIMKDAALAYGEYRDHKLYAKINR